MKPAQGPIGRSLPRARARSLVAGAGCYSDDIAPARALSVVFVRSPYAHARITHIEAEAARAMPGVHGVYLGADIARVCPPWEVVNKLFSDMRFARQHAVAVDTVYHQGEAVAAILARSRAAGEDAAEAVEIGWEPLPAVSDPQQALTPDAPVIHPHLGTNLCFHREVGGGDVERRFAEADLVVEEEFVFGRHTGVPLETRTIIADYNRAEGTLTVHQSHQVPHEMQGLYARLLRLPENKVRVICPDVGGAFGIKLQAYADEIATCALAILAGRPVKFQADRLEAFVTDVQAREHRVKARVAVTGEDITAFDVHDIAGIGPFPQLPRGTLQEALHVAQLTGAPYAMQAYRARIDVVFQNKVMSGLYRAVGQPIACAVTERLVDLAAQRLGHDPVEFRRANYLRRFPHKTQSNVALVDMAFARCHDLIVERFGLSALRADQAGARARGILRGIGVATFVELVNTGPHYYTEAGLSVTTQDRCVVTLDPAGTVRCTMSLTEFGQGLTGAMAQVVAEALGVSVNDVEVGVGDSAAHPYGGGSWASRGITMGTETAWRAARALRSNLLALAGQILQAPADALSITDGAIRQTGHDEPRMTLRELAQIAHFRHGQLPPGTAIDLSASATHVPPISNIASSGMHASYVEVDAETGFVRLLKHAVVHDCGTPINPMLVAEQLRGGTVQGIGAALFEECLYDENGQLLNGSLADYLVPMAAEMPDIEVYELESERAPGEAPAPKGVGEAGTAGASAAVLNAINDAILPRGARIAQIPCTPERVLAAFDRAEAAGTR